jgi:biopolymer transport protein ExbD
MAEIIESGGGEKGGKKRPKKGVVRMDMTPMVDLAFLLLTFFILATSLSKPKTLEIIYPKEVENNDEKTKLADELATTILIGEGEEHLFYYHGKFDPDTTVLQKTDFSKDGFRKVLLEKNRTINERVFELKADLNSKQLSKEDYEAQYKEAYSKIVNDELAPFVIVKTIDKSMWRNVVNSIDELNICNVRKRAILDMEKNEQAAVEKRVKELGLPAASDSNE